MHRALRRAFPWLGLLLVFLGPYFFFQMIDFLRKLDYTGAFFSLLAGWFLLRAGVDVSRAALATFIDQEEPIPPEESFERDEDV